MGKKKITVTKVITPDDPNTPENELKTEEVEEEVDDDSDDVEESITTSPLLDEGTPVWLYFIDDSGVFHQYVGRVTKAWTADMVNVEAQNDKGHKVVKTSVPKWKPGASLGWWSI